MKEEGQGSGGREKAPVPLLKKAGAVGFLLLVVLIAVAANNWKSNLHVRKIEVEGNNIVGEETLRELSGVDDGAPLFEVDLNSVRARLMENPFVRDVSVERDAPGGLVLSIVERVPVAAIAGTRMYFLDDQGFVLPSVVSDIVFDVPVLSGSIPQDNLKTGECVTSTHVLNALGLAKELQVMGRVNPRISEVHIAESGSIILFTAEGGIPVLVGKEDFHRKLLSFQAFWEQVVLRDDVRRLELVDVRFKGQVIARWDHDKGKQG